MGRVSLSIPWQEFVPPVFLTLADRFPYGARKRHPFNNLTWFTRVTSIVDIGANVGRVAEAALQSYPEAGVFCFEPVSETFVKLKTRLARYGNRVHAWQLGLSDCAGEHLINLTSFHGANSLHPQAAFHRSCNPHVHETGTERIQLARLDDLADELPSTIDIMKIDVEGHEVNVLRGGENVIRNCVDTLILEVSFMRDTSCSEQALFDIFDLMRQLGFCLVNIYDLHRSWIAAIQLVQMDCIFRKAVHVQDGLS